MEPASFELQDYVDDLEAVRQAMGASQVHLLGHSWGGVVAMAYTAAHPTRVSALVLAASGPPQHEVVAIAQHNLMTRVQQLQQEGMIPADLSTAPDPLKAILPAYFADPGFMSAYQGTLPIIEANQAVSDLTWEAIAGYDLALSLSEINLPVLILWGADDPFGWALPQSTVDAFSGAEPELVVLHECGHFWHECSEAFTAEVRGFLGLPTGD
jgi:proline iminopeptidase